MFAQANSPGTARHKIFNADWIIDGEQQPKSLFQMIKNTFETTPDHVLSAYKDNAAVMEGSEVGTCFADTKRARYDSIRNRPPPSDESRNSQPPTAFLRGRARRPVQR